MPDAIDGAIAAAGQPELLQVQVKLHSGKAAMLALPLDFDDTDAISLVEVVTSVRNQLRERERLLDPTRRIILPARP